MSGQHVQLRFRSHVIRLLHHAALLFLNSSCNMVPAEIWHTHGVSHDTVALLEVVPVRGVVFEDVESDFV